MVVPNQMPNNRFSAVKNSVRLNAGRTSNPQVDCLSYEKNGSPEPEPFKVILRTKSEGEREDQSISNSNINDQRMVIGVNSVLRSG